jgi:PAS domain S-box-containing protein
LAAIAHSELAATTNRSRGWSDLPLRTKGVIVLTIPLIALFASLFTILALTAADERVDGWAARSFQTRLELQSLIGSLWEADAASRAYLQTNNPALLSTTAAAETRASQVLARVASLVPGNELQELTARELGELRAMRSRGAVPRGTTMNEIRAVADRLSAREEAVLTIGMERLRTQRARFRVILMAVALIGPLGGLLGNVLLAATVVQRVRRLIRNAHLLSQGHPIESLPPAGDEIGALASEIEEAAGLLFHREQQLRESEQRFRDLFDSAPFPYHEAGRDGIIQRVNQAECRLLGYAPGEIVNRPVWEFVAPEQREETREAVLQKAMAGQDGPPFERTFVRKDGGRLPLEVHEKLIRDDRGEVIGVRRSLIDVGPRRLAAVNQMPRPEPAVRAVLVALDEPADAQWIRRLLLASGHRAEVALNPREVVAKCRERAYGAVVVSDGSTLPDQIHNTLFNRVTPVLAATMPVNSDELVGELAKVGMRPRFSMRLRA